jgi:hypothetical protein
MPNRMVEAALKVLKDNEHGITYSPQHRSIALKCKSENMQELLQAFAALANTYSPLRIDSRTADFKVITADPQAGPVIDELAKFMARSGINFVGRNQLPELQRA